MGLMDTVRAHARTHTNVDRDAESVGATNERSTKQYEVISGEETDSYRFVLRTETIPALPAPEREQHGISEDEAIAANPPIRGSCSDRGRTNWYESEAAEAAVSTLQYWYGTGALDTLPECIPGFADELAQYTDRACMIGIVRAILDSVPWSLTAQERAVQFVGVLTPLIDGRPLAESEDA